MNETTPIINPKHTMLLVMDCQPAILRNLPGAEELLPRLVEAINVARSGGVRIGYVRVGFDDADYNAIPDTNKAFSGVAAGRRMHDEAPETAIHDAVAPEPGDLVVRKTRVGAFSTTDLDQQLRALNIDTLILAGVSTSGVVLSTVREAADRDYRVYVLEDGSFDREQDVHDILTRKVFPRQAYVISIADLSNLLGPE
jgi:nicotinamidase-related amidase